MRTAGRAAGAFQCPAATLFVRVTPRAAVGYAPLPSTPPHPGTRDLDSEDATRQEFPRQTASTFPPTYACSACLTACVLLCIRTVLIRICVRTHTYMCKDALHGSSLHASLHEQERCIQGRMECAVGSALKAVTPRDRKCGRWESVVRC
jgi:hypothetical protein